MNRYWTYYASLSYDAIYRSPVQCVDDLEMWNYIISVGYKIKPSNFLMHPSRVAKRNGLND